MFNSILVPIDIAHPSSWKSALPEALQLARQNNATIKVMTVVRELSLMFEGIYFSFQLEQLMSEAKTKLAKIASDHATADVPIGLEVRLGSIRREILSAAREGNADLIVMASHRPEVKDYLIGPNASFVAAHAPCSVLVLRKYM